MDWEKLEGQDIKVDYTIEVLSEKLNKYTYLANKADEEATHATEDYQMADDLKDITRAIIIGGQKGDSYAEKERLAKTSEHWRELIDNLATLRRAKQEAQLYTRKYDRIISALRSQLATKRKEIELG